MLSDPSARLAAPVVERSPRARVRLLLDGGDRAYAHGDALALAHVARTLIPDVHRHIQYELVAVAELASLDLEAAQRRWIDASRRIRERVGLGADV
jgi:hypothetical protein